jgi:PBP1b-binding outer membrane lipoprotein LpoB
MKKLLLFPALLFVGCSNMTPEQQAQWSATANVAAQQASTILLNEAEARLKESRKHSTSDSKDSTVNDGP